ERLYAFQLSPGAEMWWRSTGRCPVAGSTARPARGAGRGDPRDPDAPPRPPRRAAGGAHRRGAVLLRYRARRRAAAGAGDHRAAPGAHPHRPGRRRSRGQQALPGRGEFLERRRALEEEHLGTLRTALPRVPLQEVPLREEDVVGPAALERFAQLLRPWARPRHRFRLSHHHKTAVYVRRTAQRRSPHTYGRELVVPDGRELLAGR